MIGNRTPVNRTAGLVISRGEHWTPTKKVQTVESDAFLPTRSPRPIELRNRDFKNLAGIVFGRFEVVGQYRDGKGWVCRCQCGRYAVRKSKAITNPANSQDRCEHCRELEYIKKNHQRRELS